MKKPPMLKFILIAIPVILVIFFIIVAMQPSDYGVKRSLAIGAPPDAVFRHVNELKNWEAWSPWGKVDPNMKLSYDGPSSGVGASYAWVGNREVGEGRATITESRANEFVQFKFEFFKPMASVSIAEFTFQPRGNQTEVTWIITGKKNFLAKAFCLFMSMDKMIGGRLAMGLSDLKAIAEAPAKQSSQ
jgi:hypothetical protein